MNQIIILADTPNLYRSVQAAHGACARPDYDEIYQIAQTYRGVVRAIGFVNQGVNDAFVRSLDSLGFDPVYSHAADVDHALIAAAVELAPDSDRLVLCSGDGDYCPVARLLRRIGIALTVIAEPSSCSRWLRSMADFFVSVPVFGCGHPAGCRKTPMPIAVPPFSLQAA